MPPPPIGVLPPATQMQVCWSTLAICANCHKPNATKACSCCRASKYCSKECQKKDWKQGGHKYLCPVLTSLDFPSWVEEAKKVPDNNLPQPEPQDLEIDPQDEMEQQKKLEKALGLQWGRTGILSMRDQLIASQQQVSSPTEWLDSLPHQRQNRKKAIELFLEIAKTNKGKAAGVAMLIYCFVGLDKDNDHDETERLKYIRRAAQIGIPEAQLRYGREYWLDGRHGHAMDLEQAVRWIRRALEHGGTQVQIGTDPRGEYLSPDAFRVASELAAIHGRKLYLQKFPMTFSEEAGYDDEIIRKEIEVGMKLAAMCGTGPAMHQVFRKVWDE